MNIKLTLNEETLKIAQTIIAKTIVNKEIVKLVKVSR